MSFRKTTREEGSALVLALMIMVIMSLLGLSFALVAETENKISLNERHQAQALYVAEGAVRVVKKWFDDPTTGYMLPTVSQADRTLRYVDPDGDGTYQSYTSASAPWNVIYRSGTDDLFEKPYRGSPSRAFEGTAANPDVRISDAGSAGEQSYLTSLNDSIAPTFPNSRLRALVRQIDVYSPPILTVGTDRLRYGIATVRVKVGIFENTGTAQQIQVGERVVEGLLNEAPYPGPGGPLQSGLGISANGDFNIHWGGVTAVTSGDLASNVDAKLNSSVPWYDIDHKWTLDNTGDSVPDNFDGDGVVDFYEWFNNADNSIEDPWLVFWFGGTWDGPGTDDGTANNQPLDFGPVRPPSPPGIAVDPDTEHSNVFLHVDRELFPNVDYDLWKNAARSGEKNLYYYTYDSGSGLFLEDGDATRTPVSVEDATTGRVGLFFFDTTDARRPHDDDNDGLYDNLTPAVTIQGSGWWSGGFIYLNASLMKTTGVGNVPDRPMQAPGEPFIDTNGDGTLNSTEYFLNLNYPSSYVGTNLFYDKANWTTPATAPGGVVCNSSGPSHNENIHMYGVVYTNGQWEAKGSGVYYGAVLAKEGVGETTSGAAGTPDVFFDERLIRGNWPPPELKLPRTLITSWKTDM